MFDFLKQGQVSLKDMEKEIKALPFPERLKIVAIYRRYKKIREAENVLSIQNKKIEKQFLKKDAPLIDNISAIIQGKKAVTEEELKDADKYLTDEEIKQVKVNLGSRRIPDYWFKVISNSKMVQQFVGEEDSPLLKAIQNIKVIDEENTDDFTIVIDFAENQIIKNKELTKKFYVKDDVAYKTEGTVIEWVDKDLTVKQVKKKQKNKKTGQQRIITKMVKAKSFFNFFRSHENTEENKILKQEGEESVKQQIEGDFELGGVLVDDIIPYSLEYFLGVEHEEDDEFDEDGFDEEEFEDEEEEKNEKKKKSQSKDKKSSQKNQRKGSKDAPECKNQ